MTSLSQSAPQSRCLDTWPALKPLFGYMARRKAVVWVHGSSHALSSPLFFPVCCGSSHLQSPRCPSRESSSGLFARGRLRSTFAAPLHKSFPVSTCSSRLSLFFVLFSLAVLCPLGQSAALCPLGQSAALCPLGQSTAPLPALGQSAAFAPPVRGRGMVPIEWQYLRWCWQGARVAPIGEAPVFSRA